MVEEEEEPPPSSQPKKLRMSYDDWSDSDLKGELRTRKFKVGRNLSKEALVTLLEEDDKSQRRITLWRRNNEGEKEPSNHSSGTGRGGGEEEEGNRALTNPGLEEEDSEWVDILPGGRAAAGSETMERTVRKPRLGRTTPSKGAGRLQGGQGKRGFWLRRREVQTGGGRQGEQG